MRNTIDLKISKDALIDLKNGKIKKLECIRNFDGENITINISIGD
jgi:hypothetical protein